MTWNTFPLVLEWSTDITPTVRHLAFRRADQEPFEYAAGQFINIHWDRDGERTHRSYSVVTAPGSSQLIEIAIAPVDGGFASGRLFALRPGDMVEASGPYGRFVLREDPPCRYLLVATGTGVTPYRSMLPDLEKLIAGQGFRVELLLGVRRREELLYPEDFLALAESSDDFTFRACYSRALPEAPQPWETQGYVQQHFDSLGLDVETDIVYLCGNPNMIDEAAASLKETGFGIKQVRREKYLHARR